MLRHLIAALAQECRGDTATAAVQQALNIIIQELRTMSVNIAALTASVERTRGVEASVLVLMQGLRDQVQALSANNIDPALQTQIDALAASLEEGALPLANAAAANPTPPGATATPPEATPVPDAPPAA